MSTLNSIRKGDWSTGVFWSDVDELTERQIQKILEEVGGRAASLRKFTIKTMNASYKGLNVRISHLDYACLLFNAGLTVDSVSQDGYHLARVNDRGDYRRRRCRFLSCSDNAREKVISERSRLASRECGLLTGPSNVKKAHKKLEELRSKDPKSWSKLASSMGRKSQESRKSLKGRDPVEYRRIYAKLLGAAGARKKRQAEERDERLKRRVLSKKARGQVGYPEVGWKANLARELGVTRKTLVGFLRRNPEYPSKKLVEGGVA